MPGFVHFMRCVGRAAVRKGVRALAGLVPFGDVALDIVTDAHAEYSRDNREADLRAALEGLAQAPLAEVRQAAEQVAAEVAAGQPHDISLALVSYLDQVPASVRQSLRRPADSSGTTVPAGLSLGKPEDLLRFLPTALPRFKPGDRPLAADWELVEMLGKGGFGEVWKARHIHQSRKKPVALKFCLDPVAAASLRNEAALHDLLDRVREEASAPGIVPLLETYLRADPPCLMYELIEGGDLAGFIREMHEQGRMTPDFATRVIHRLASIVAAAHRLNPPLVHRDLKLSNALVRRGQDDLPDLFAADFGIGGLAAGQALREQAGRRTVSGQTLPAAVRGAYTPLYASPQQAAGGPPDPRDDVHALGVIWYQLVAGDLALMAVPPDWREVAEERGLGGEEVRLLAACIASPAEKRLASAAELADRVAALPKGVPTASPYVLDRVDREKAEGRRREQEAAEQRSREAEVQRRREEEQREAAERQAREAEGRRQREEQELAESKAANLRRLKESGRLDAWVEARPQVWDHAGWLGLLADLERTGFCPIEHERLGLLLEEIRRDKAEVRRKAEVPREVEVTVPGKWTPTPKAPGGKKTQVSTPAVVPLAPGHVYDLDVDPATTDDQLAGLARLKGVAPLWSLTLSGCGRLTDAGLAHLRGLTALKSLDLTECVRLTDGGLAPLRELTSLQWLKLSGCTGLTGAGLDCLGGLASLQLLNLSKCTRLTDAGLAHLRGLASLQTLSLYRCEGVTDAGLAHLRGLTSLGTLSLSSCPRVTDAGLAHLRGLPSLAWLTLSGERLTDDGLAHLRGLASLRVIDLVACTWLTDAGLAHLGTLPALESLNLYMCEGVTDVGLAHLRGLTRLARLNLGDCRKLTDAGLAHLREHTALESLTLSGCPLLTDAGLTHLRGLASLTVLYLSGCTGLTEAGLNALRQALPRCRISS